MTEDRDTAAPSRRDLLVAASAAASVSALVPLPVFAEAAPAVPALVQVSWLEGEARGSGEATIATITAAMVSVASSGRATWVQRQA